MHWISDQDDIDRAKRLQAVFDGNNALDPADRRVLVQALGEFISSYHAGRRPIITQGASAGVASNFARIGEATRGLSGGVA